MLCVLGGEGGGNGMPSAAQLEVAGGGAVDQSGRFSLLCWMLLGGNEDRDTLGISGTLLLLPAWGQAVLCTGSKWGD